MVLGVPIFKHFRVKTCFILPFYDTVFPEDFQIYLIFRFASLTYTQCSRKEGVPGIFWDNFPYSSSKQMLWPSDIVLMSGHNICFHGEIRKVIAE